MDPASCGGIAIGAAEPVYDYESVQSTCCFFLRMRCDNSKCCMCLKLKKKDRILMETVGEVE